MKRLILSLLLLTSAPALAVDPAEMLKDPAQEARAREIGAELRCLVCQNQSIDDSDADLAKDLRQIVRERISAGDSDSAVKQFLVDRYGDYVLLKPPFNPKTWLLWLGPLGLALAAGLVGRAYYRRQRREGAAPQPLSAEEQRELERIMKDQG
ncbi:MAG: cytochrome c-type biogenesis protein CcmH [Alphaproteobacteria bacterium]|nr:cytochrome c-type biogenesis protein CcmH [Alphaproteobacteria bacterium]MBF0356170.1 cytochrome c-type biogenesis protein CcmH [Alphaproteobacteria bacterium]